MISYDFETWGLHENAEIISLGVVKFDPLVRDSYPTLVERGQQWFFDGSAQHGRTRGREAIEFWEKMGGAPELIDPEAYLFHESLDDFIDEHVNEMWVSKGWKDPMWFDQLFPKTISYRNFLDMRSIMFAKNASKYANPPKGHKNNRHSALHDAAAQAWQIQRSY